MSEENLSCSSNSVAFTLPFPPHINIFEIVRKRLKKNPEKIGSRGPNCWLIYRAYYVFEYNKFKSSSRKLSMTELSPQIAKAWGNESYEVKKEYQNIAAKVEEELIRQRKETLVYTSSCTRKKHFPPTIKPPAYIDDSKVQTAGSEKSVVQKEIPNSQSANFGDIFNWTLNFFNHASELPGKNNNNDMLTSEHTMTTNGNFPFNPNSIPLYHYQPVNSNLPFTPQCDNYGFNVNTLPISSVVLPVESPFYSYFTPVQSTHFDDGLSEDNYAFYDPLLSRQHANQ
ncbi:25196_t:CDS:2 [Dentiscutata erythropus]|uniref:25196_t:CDS:1 n=1 Tax=Dentiscutata erythropus TaxID=1348616 RepID=A0A9N9GLN2_9GLOM|nr:25196_t:CDS:2 [Dentiscutata erythropus]